MRIELRLATRAAGLVCLAGLIVLAGCFSLSRTEPPQRHYVLGAEAAREDGMAAPALAGLAIGVRRLRLAPYLDPPFVVVRHGPNQIRYSEYHRWGEPLGGGINRAVAGYLAAGTPFRAVDTAPWPPREQYDYLIQLHVERFEGLIEDPADTEGEVLMVATWEIVRQRDGFVLARGTTEHRERAWLPGDYAALVRSLDAGLNLLARDVTAGLAEVAGRASMGAER
jgi:uncharacterized protein